MRSIIIALAAVALSSQPALAQNEAALRAAFEGKTLTVKVDMPATSRGIDVFPGESMPVNWRDVAQRIKDNGTALRIGTRVMITKVVVKKDSHIEFQLGGGGYGTVGDFMTGSSSVHAVSEGESREERELREQIKQAQGPTRRKQLERELASRRAERERENSRAQAEAAQANEAREANLRVKRAESGSRFNIRYRQGIPPYALTAEGVAEALSPYVDFGDAVAPAVVAQGTPAGNGAAASPTVPAPAAREENGAAESAARGVASLRKGLSLAEVEEILGPATTANEVREGAMLVMKRQYACEGKKVAASFIGGVLIDFAITPL